MKKRSFNLEDFIIDKQTGKVYFVIGIPLTCKNYVNSEPVYIMATRAGNTLVITKNELESNNNFMLQKNNI